MSKQTLKGIDHWTVDYVYIEASHSSEATEMKCLFHDWFICDEDDDDDDDE